jgi:hypothetical protein
MTPRQTLPDFLLVPSKSCSLAKFIADRGEMREMSGGCLCGQVRYSANADPAMDAVCHCKNCQKQAGTAFTAVVGIPKSAISIQEQLKTFRDTGDSGQPVEGDARRFLDAMHDRLGEFALSLHPTRHA